MTNRIEKRFAELKEQNRGGLVTFLTAGDPDFDASFEIIKGLPKAGVDLIELGMPFSDPMADGPAIQEASMRALNTGMTLNGVIEMVTSFRKKDSDTPIILMGYYNPIYVYGIERFAEDAAKAGADGMIIVDIPPEEADEFLVHLKANNVSLIFLTAPTTDDERLPIVLENASGFVYYVSITGVTGTASASEDAVEKAVARIKKHTDLPVAVGFGIKTPEQAGAVSKIADAAVVGSAIIKIIADSEENKKPKPEMIADVLDFVKKLADEVRK